MERVSLVWVEKREGEMAEVANRVNWGWRRSSEGDRSGRDTEECEGEVGENEKLRWSPGRRVCGGEAMVLSARYMRISTVYGRPTEGAGGLLPSPITVLNPT
jgi:hypothetical protein